VGHAAPADSRRPLMLMLQGRKNSGAPAGDVIARLQGLNIAREQVLAPLIEAHGLSVLINVVQLELAKRNAQQAGVAVTDADVAAERQITLSQAFNDDVARKLREQIDEAVAAGLRYVQLDYPLYPMLLDEQYLDIFAAMDGSTFDSLMDRCIAADEGILEGLPEDVTRAIHLCRGNWRSRHMVSGSLEPVAERFFALPYDAFFIEWEDVRREGGYDSLRHVPKGPIVYVGIVNTKVPEVEPADELVRKIETATKYIDVSQLAISPQCGFASTMHGNELDEDSQWRKLEEMVKAAEKVWGGVPAAA
jgi:5-methyltetrahydropteroyltriglutamate--homocysteine methyltransferase